MILWKYLEILILIFQVHLHSPWWLKEWHIQTTAQFHCHICLCLLLARGIWSFSILVNYSMVWCLCRSNGKKNQKDRFDSASRSISNFFFSKNITNSKLPNNKLYFKHCNIFFFRTTSCPQQAQDEFMPFLVLFQLQQQS